MLLKTFGLIRRRIAILLAVLIGFIIIGSSVYEISESKHECSGEECAVCMLLHMVREVRSKLGKDTVFCLTAIISVLAFTYMIKPVRVYVRSHTPVSDKVRLDN